MKSKCCNSNVFIKEKSGQKCVYCRECGKFVKNANKEDLRLIEENNITTGEISHVEFKMVNEIKRFIEAIDKSVEFEYNVLPISLEDAMRKNSKCYELDRVKYSLENIIMGREFDYKD